jgi:hypothetical protein
VAEILIQRKRRRSMWPWLLGLLALALLPLPFMIAPDRRVAARERRAPGDSVIQRDTTTVPDTASSRLAQTAATAAAADTAATAAPGRERTTVTAGGSIAPPDTSQPMPPVRSATPAKGASSEESVERFIAAGDPKSDARAHRQYTAGGLRRLADELRSVGASEAGVRAIRVNADSLQMASARRSARPDYARAAFLAAVHELDVLRGRYRVAIDTGRLRSSAWAIRPERPLDTQRGMVQQFFETARDALHSLPRSQ